MAEGTQPQVNVPSDHAVVYANTCDITVGPAEAFLDFSLVEPFRRGQGFRDEARFVARITIPQALLAPMTAMLNRVTAQLDESKGG